MMKAKVMGSLLVGVAFLTLTGCGATMQHTSVPLQGGGKLHLTEVNWGEKNPLVGGGVNKHYVAEVLLKDGKQQKVEIYGKSHSVSTGQQVLANLPGVLVGGAVGFDRNNAIEKSQQIAARAALLVARTNQETTKYAVDNTQPTRVYNMEDNRVFVGTETDLNVEMDVTQGGGCSIGGAENPCK